MNRARPDIKGPLKSDPMWAPPKLSLGEATSENLYPLKAPGVTLVSGPLLLSEVKLELAERADGT